MVAPLIAAAARAAIKGAAKAAVKGATKATKATVRKSTKAGSSAGVRGRGDDLYNARKRFTRQAERYAKKARSESGTLRSKYESLAKMELNNALSTYSSTPKSKKVIDLMQELGVSRDDYKAPGENRSEYLVSRSMKSLEETRRTPESRREYEAKSVLNSNIGKRVYGGLSSVWKGAEDINGAIMAHFGVDSMADVLEQIEAQINLYSDPDALEKYDEIKAAIELAFA